MLEELLKHLTDRCCPARLYSLLGAPHIDLLDQLRLDPDVDIRGFPFHADKLGRCRVRCLMMTAKKLILRATGLELRTG